MKEETPVVESEFKFFDRWDGKDVEIKDISLIRYVSLKTKRIPATFGRHNKKAFQKTQISIVERLVNKIMRSGQGKRKLSGKYIRGRGSTGKKMQALEIVEKAFELIEKETKKNPLQVLVEAIQNAAPREDTTRFKRGGLAYSQSVDVAPIKRLDEAIKNLAIASFANSFNKPVSAEKALADEIVLASQENVKSFAVKRRDEMERIAKSSR